MVFEQVNLVEGDTGLFDGATGRVVHSFEVKHVFAIVQSQGVGRGGGACDLDEWMSKI